MNYNPYAPPAAPVAPNAGPPPRGAPEPWAIGDVLKSAWEIYKTHWAPLTLGVFVVTMIPLIPGQLPVGLVAGGVIQEKSTAYWLVNIPCTLLGQITTQYFATCMTRTALRASRENNVTFGDFFGANGRFLSFLGMTLLSTLAILVTVPFFVVPAVIVMLGFFNAGFFVVDQNMGPIEALKASWDSTDGHKGTLFLYWI